MGRELWSAGGTGEGGKAAVRFYIATEGDIISILIYVYIYL